MDVLVFTLLFLVLSERIVYLDYLDLTISRALLEGSTLPYHWPTKELCNECCDVQWLKAYESLISQRGVPPSLHALTPSLPWYPPASSLFNFVPVCTAFSFILCHKIVSPAVAWAERERRDCSAHVSFTEQPYFLFIYFFGQTTFLCVDCLQTEPYEFSH